jgi:hypothetical protein
MPTSEAKTSQPLRPALTALDNGDLDSVEVVLDIERQFAISIPAAEAECLTTVGALHRLVCRLSSIPVSGRCPSVRAHGGVCRALAQAGVERSLWRPSAEVGRLQEPHQVRQWNKVAAALGLGPFRLGRSRQMRRTMFNGALLTGLAGMSIFLFLGLTGAGALGCSAAVTIIAWIIGVFATAPRATYPPFAATRELTMTFLASRFEDYARATWTPQEHEAWIKLVRILARQYGVRADRIVPSTRIVGNGSLSLLDPVLKALGAH